MFSKTSVTIALLVLSIASIQSEIQAGEIVFNDAANAKMAKIKGKARIFKNTRKQDVITADGQEKINNASDCGSIKIANSSGKKGVGAMPKKVEVFVIGDIINTGNNC